MFSNFKKIDGTHPWRDVRPEGYLDYPVKFRRGGKVIYFNFDLAKELQLIPASYPHRMNASLEDVILKTFSLSVINEYDLVYKKRIPPGFIEGRMYMATRYLQSQHKNKQGVTSGDGRSIWNGFLKTPSATFDISSRGTGATILSPGIASARKLLPSGDEGKEYSSGLADLDEMLSSAIMSEVFYRQGIPTERCLTVIAYSDNTSVGVRSAPNLIRPAHIFRYLKMNRLDDLSDSFEYFLKRQEKNKTVRLPGQKKQRYQEALKYLALTYAKLSAVMEEEYIFNWLAWDGDNMLASGAVLDYGSIRQFAAKHNKYRFKDVDRYSSSLTEQRFWARRIVQTFIQAADFILTRRKKKLESFKNDPALKIFDNAFKNERTVRLLWRMGFNQRHITKLTRKNNPAMRDFRRIFNYFEDKKTSAGIRRVADGIDHPPVFLIRRLLRELPLYILDHWKKDTDPWPLMPSEKFCAIMAASYTDKKDVVFNHYSRTNARRFQQSYARLIRFLSAHPRKILREIAERSAVINFTYRGTGNALISIVEEILKSRRKINQRDIQSSIDRYIGSQVLIPGQWQPLTSKELQNPSPQSRLLNKIMGHLKEYQEMI